MGAIMHAKFLISNMQLRAIFFQQRVRRFYLQTVILEKHFTHCRSVKIKHEKRGRISCIFAVVVRDPHCTEQMQPYLSKLTKTERNHSSKGQFSHLISINFLFTLKKPGFWRKNYSSWFSNLKVFRSSVVSLSVYERKCP